MRRCLSILMGLLLGVVLSVSSVDTAYAQKKGKSASTKETRISGTVQTFSKESKTITVRVRGVTRTVVWDANTQVTYNNKPATLDELKEGRRAICLGKFNDKAQLMATRCEFAEEKGR